MDMSKSADSSSTSSAGTDPEFHRKLEETVQAMTELADQLSSSTSFQSVRIAKQLEDYASALRRLRNAMAHGGPFSGAAPSTSSKSAG